MLFRVFLYLYMEQNFIYDLISVGAHPDDAEVGTGGLLIDLSKRGKKCGIVILTKGEMGTGGDEQIRQEEIRQAAEIMGADIIESFDWGDTSLNDSYEHQKQLAEIIRKTRPKILTTPYPQVGHGKRQSHPDHVATGVITINAANLARLKKADVAGEPHTVQRIFHYFLPPRVTPDFVVDITEHFDLWLKALSAHKSQFLNPDKPIDYIENLTNMARSFGAQAGCKYGQGFRSAEPLLIKNLMNLVE